MLQRVRAVWHKLQWNWFSFKEGRDAEDFSFDAGARTGSSSVGAAIGRAGVDIAEGG
jgi:hypothetical protein